MKRSVLWRIRNYDEPLQTVPGSTQTPVFFIPDTCLKEKNSVLCDSIHPLRYWGLCLIFILLKI